MTHVTDVDPVPSGTSQLLGAVTDGAMASAVTKHVLLIASQMSARRSAFHKSIGTSIRMHQSL